tara:strand:- start:2086 stop:2511 length:426 start_codon:yes stop_codon:yes gene_type:complete
MKKSELKNIIKECVREVLFEEGALSDIIVEVTAGLVKSQSMLLESTHHVQKQKTKSNSIVSAKKEQEQRTKKLRETKKRMLDAIGDSSLKTVFEGTEPLTSAGNPNEQPSASPLSGIDPNDKGVDISGIMKIAGQKWQNLK